MTKQDAVNKLITWALGEVDYHEGPNNYNKYAEHEDVAKLLGWKAQNQPWCDLWTDAGFVINFGLNKASALTYQPIGHGSAACRYSAEFFRANGAFTQSPEAGDVIFFLDSAGVINHQGLVERVSGGIVYTIEGNSSDKVSRRAYAVGAKNIAGYGRPNWSVLASEAPSEEPTTQVKTCRPRLPILKRGMSGAAVKSVQLLLLSAGYDCGPDGPDGEYGQNTYSAVRKFKDDHNLGKTGTVGVNMYSLLIGGVDNAY